MHTDSKKISREIVTLQRYKTSDGKVFDTCEEAEEHLCKSDFIADMVGLVSSSALFYHSIGNGLTISYDNLTSEESNFNEGVHALIKVMYTRREEVLTLLSRKSGPDYSKLDTPIFKVSSDVRTQNALEAAGIAFVGDIVVYSEDKLKQVKGLGSIGVKVLIGELEAQGMALGMITKGWVRPGSPVNDTLLRGVFSAARAYSHIVEGVLEEIVQLEEVVRSRLCLPPLPEGSISGASDEAANAPGAVYIGSDPAVGPDMEAACEFDENGALIGSTLTFTEADQLEASTDTEDAEPEWDGKPEPNPDDAVQSPMPYSPTGAMLTVGYERSEVEHEVADNADGTSTIVITDKGMEAVRASLALTGNEEMYYSFPGIEETQQASDADESDNGEPCVKVFIEYGDDSELPVSISCKSPKKYQVAIFHDSNGFLGCSPDFPEMEFHYDVSEETAVERTEETMQRLIVNMLKSGKALPPSDVAWTNEEIIAASPVDGAVLRLGRLGAFVAVL